MADDLFEVCVIENGDQKTLEPAISVSPLPSVPDKSESTESDGEKSENPNDDNEQMDRITSLSPIENVDKCVFFHDAL